MCLKRFFFFSPFLLGDETYLFFLFRKLPAKFVLKFLWRFDQKPKNALSKSYSFFFCLFLFPFQDAYQTDCCKKMIICSNCVKMMKITSPNAHFNPSKSYTFSASSCCPFCQTPKYTCVPNHPVRKIVEKFAIFMENYEEERRLDALEGRRKAENESKKREEERKRKEAIEKKRREEEDKKREEEERIKREEWERVRREEERLKKIEEEKKRKIEERKRLQEEKKKKREEELLKRRKEQEKKRKEAEERKKLEQAKKKEEERKKKEEEKRKREEENRSGKKKEKEKEEEVENGEKLDMERILARGTEHLAWLTSKMGEKFKEVANFSALKTLCLLSSYFFHFF